LIFRGPANSLTSRRHPPTRTPPRLLKLNIRTSHRRLPTRTPPCLFLAQGTDMSPTHSPAALIPRAAGGVRFFLFEILPSTDLSLSPDASFITEFSIQVPAFQPASPRVPPHFSLRTFPPRLFIIQDTCSCDLRPPYIRFIPFHAFC
jgi:hypothetical protein